MLKITGRNLRELRNSGIYIWKRGEEFLYIGKSYKLIHRVVTHTIIDKVEDLKPDDIIEFHYFKRAELDVIEMELIRKHKPKYNVRNYDPSKLPLEKQEQRERVLANQLHMSIEEVKIFIDETKEHAFNTSKRNNKT